jgi:formylglycine-generating enzyme required for sulfatase activity
MDNGWTERLRGMTDDALLQMTNEEASKYPAAAIESAQAEAAARGLVSKLGDTSFKVIIGASQQSGILNPAQIKAMYLNGVVTDTSLVYVQSKGRWLFLAAVFDSSYWKREANSAPKKLVNRVQPPEPAESPAPRRSQTRAAEVKETPPASTPVVSTPTDVTQSHTSVNTQSHAGVNAQSQTSVSPTPSGADSYTQNMARVEELKRLEEERERELVMLRRQIEEEERRRREAEEAARLVEKEARRRIEEEARLRAEEARLRAEAEEKRRVEEESRLRQAEEARRRAEEELRRREEDRQRELTALRRKIEEEERRRQEAEEVARRAEEAKLRAEAESRQRAEETRRRVEEATRITHEAGRRRAEEEAARRLAEEEEAARLRAEEEARRKVKEEEARRKAKEEEAARRKAKEEEARRKAKEEETRQREEARRTEEARRRDKEEKTHKHTQEEAARRRAEAEARRRAEEESRRRADEESRLRAEAELRRREEEEARIRADEEARRRAEEAALRLAEEDTQRRAQAEQRRREEEARRREEERQREEEARLRAEHEARLRAEQEARLRAEQEARLRAEQEARLRAEEDARLRAIEDARLRDIEDARLRAIEEARLRAIEDTRLRAESERGLASEELIPDAEQAGQSGVDGASYAEAGVQGSAATRLPNNGVNWPARAAGPQRGGDGVEQVWAGASEHARQPAQHLAEVFPSFDTGEKKPFLTLPIIAAGAGVVLLLLAVLMYMIFSPAKPATVAPETATTEEKPAPKSDMMDVTGGSFMMGRNDISTASQSYNQWPAHSVTVRSFQLDRTEVTNAEYADFVRETNHEAPSHWQGTTPKAGEERLPVTNVSLDDAKQFAEWRSKRDGVTYRLPTEEEWEYAARGTDPARRYPWGNTWIDGRANVESEALKPVGSFNDGASPSGALDMIGNAWEWTSSEATIYAGNTQKTPEPGKYVMRGGSYKSSPKGDRAITAMYREFIAPTTRHPTLGFRLVREGR